MVSYNNGSSFLIFAGRPFLFQKAMTGNGHRTNFSALQISHRISDLIFHTLEGCQLHFNGNSIPKMRHGFIFTIHEQHRTDDSCCFHFLYGKTISSMYANPRFFHPADIIRMMYDSHLIRLIILCLVHIFHRFLPPCSLHLLLPQNRHQQVLLHCNRFLRIFKEDRYGCSFSRLTFQIQFSAMLCHNMLDDCQTKTCSTCCLGTTLIHR